MYVWDRVDIIATLLSNMITFVKFITNPLSTSNISVTFHDETPHIPLPHFLMGKMFLDHLFYCALAKISKQHTQNTLIHKLLIFF